MRSKVILALGMAVCFAAPTCCSIVYRAGFQTVVCECILEAFRAGLIDRETAMRWTVRLSECADGGN